MSYLARLKHLERGEIFHHTPKPEPTKPTKGASDGFVGSIPGAYENIHTENDANETRNLGEHWRWRIHFADRNPVEVYCDPHETHAGILKCYPDALAAEPLPERITPADADAVAWPTLKTTDDERRTCDQCTNLARRRCLAAWRCEIVANRDYEPVRDILRRCEGYAPGADDPDTRPGRERWPELIRNREANYD